MVHSLEAGLKAYADREVRRAHELRASAPFEPRSAAEQMAAAEVTRKAEECPKPPPVDGMGSLLRRFAQWLIREKEVGERSLPIPPISFPSSHPLPFPFSSLSCREAAP